MAAELKPVYLLTGSDRPKIVLALRRLRSHFEETAVQQLAASEASGEDVVATCNALGLGGGGRLIVVDGVEGWKASDAKEIAAYVETPAPDTVLTLVGSEVKAEAPLAKACAKAGEVLQFDLPKHGRKTDLPGWVASQFGRAGAAVEPEACRALIDLVGDDLYELASEIDKLATWAGGETITAADVENVTVGRAETSIFSLTDAWGRRDVARVLAACESLLEWSGHPRAREVPRLVGMLASHVARVRACQALEAEGVAPRDAAARLKMHPYAAEKAFAHARNFSPEELRAATVRLAELDLALKGKSRLAGDLELDRALVDLTRGNDVAGPQPQLSVS
jgi:DNA polymerase-3 subunit delta